jgi:hypothetical protein
MAFKVKAVPERTLQVSQWQRMVSLLEAHVSFMCSEKSGRSARRHDIGVKWLDVLRELDDPFGFGDVSILSYSIRRDDKGV